MSFSSSLGESTSTPIVPSQFLGPFGQETGYAALQAALEQAQYAWAQQQFAKDSQLTDQVVQQYLQNVALAQGMSLNDLQRYRGLFQPEENELGAGANSS